MWKSLWRGSCRVTNNLGSKTTRRTIHNEWPKRGRIPNNKWNHYDELKLMSYSSHLAFFMLLPPLVKMYMTKVEVIRDDTLLESPFLKLEPVFEMQSIIERQQQQQQKREINVYDTLLAKVEGSFDQLQRKEITKVQYLNVIETVSGKLSNGNGNEGKEEKEGRFKLIEVIFNQLRWSRYKKQMVKLFKRLLVSETPLGKVKKLNIRRSIIQKYEKNKGNKISNEVPLDELIVRSQWLRKYVNDNERLKQVLKVVIEGQEENNNNNNSNSNRVIKKLLRVCIRGDISMNLKGNRHDLESIVRLLREKGFNDEAIKLKGLL